MNNNKLIIAAAGSGKTTHIIKESMKNRDQRVLITTYTEENEQEIKKKYIQKYKCIPNHITIQTWFSFLIQHGVKPYQGSFNDELFDFRVDGMLLNDGTYGYKYFTEINGRKIGIPYKEDENIIKHYFTNSGKIYSDRLPKFVVKSNKITNGEVINRISRIFPLILVDEVQDLAGYDLEILKLLFKSKSEVLLVGDPRQVTYLTHHENKYAKYKNGKIKSFIEEECKRPIEYNIDTSSLNCSHRNNNQICEFSHKLYIPEGYDKISPCECSGCRTYDVDDEGIYLVKSIDVDAYLQKYNPVQLRWSVKRKVNPNFSVYNFGESKGKTFERVIIYPTDKMEKWVYRNSTSLPFSTKAKFYVAITRARYSVAIVTNYADDIIIEGVNLFKSDS